MDFDLHPRLTADTVLVTDWPLCQVRLMNDRTYPWLVLIPRLAEIRELWDLSAHDRGRLMEETSHAAQCLRDLTQADKMNVASLGNQVPQLHVHVIARFTNDPAWPNPVWGARPSEAYDHPTLAHTLTNLRETLKRPPRNLQVVSQPV
ncbi:HIT domain-containing protein [Roseospirillum parvum]|uniref:Diadenosine tetraphosphate (Ap4A) hydrolase n=1 Tax=Roseospirillum parvum TaxID=83401 RepID=A0A1G7ZWU2_9PROT|nr:HIT family protein [Roseospirillum parvum]SDH13103.1 Diadenosine tetraphosphate (Ap4A) hydrolase [Roseospirillum parvum]